MSIDVVLNRSDPILEGRRSPEGRVDVRRSILGLLSRWRQDKMWLDRGVSTGRLKQRRSG